jgi:hypothetical protein
MVQTSIGGPVTRLFLKIDTVRNRCRKQGPTWIGSGRADFNESCCGHEDSRSERAGRENDLPVDSDRLSNNRITRRRDPVVTTVGDVELRRLSGNNLELILRPAAAIIVHVMKVCRARYVQLRIILGAEILHEHPALLLDRRIVTRSICDPSRDDRAEYVSLRPRIQTQRPLWRDFGSEPLSWFLCRSWAVGWPLLPW